MKSGITLKFGPNTEKLLQTEFCIDSQYEHYEQTSNCSSLGNSQAGERKSSKLAETAGNEQKQHGNYFCGVIKHCAIE